MTIILERQLYTAFETMFSSPLVPDKISELMENIFKNILNNPTEARYRCLRQSNPYVKSVLSIPGAMEIFNLIGFTLEKDFLVNSGRTDHMRAIEVAHSVLLKLAPPSPNPTKNSTSEIVKKPPSSVYSVKQDSSSLYNPLYELPVVRQSRQKNVSVGCRLLGINGTLFIGMKYQDYLDRLSRSSWPLKLRFLLPGYSAINPYSFNESQIDVCFEKYQSPLGLVFDHWSNIVEEQQHLQDRYQQMNDPKSMHHAEIQIRSQLVKNLNAQAAVQSQLQVQAKMIEGHRNRTKRKQQSAIQSIDNEPTNENPNTKTTTGGGGSSSSSSSSSSSRDSIVGSIEMVSRSSTLSSKEKDFQECSSDVSTVSCSTDDTIDLNQMDLILVAEYLHDRGSVTAEEKAFLEKAGERLKALEKAYQQVRDNVMAIQKLSMHALPLDIMETLEQVPNQLQMD